jgi:hypothetical protein
VPQAYKAASGLLRREAHKLTTLENSDFVRVVGVLVFHESFRIAIYHQTIKNPAFMPGDST